VRLVATHRPLNIAVVGAGFALGADGRENWGVRTHLPALKRLPGLFKVVAVCTSRIESARRTAQHFDVPHAFDDYHALMRMDDLDVVSIVVRPRLHHPVAMAALAAGKHVYCEWPLALDANEAREMSELARRKNLHTAVGTQGHFWPSAERMRELVANGYIGRPLTFGASTFVSNYIAPRPAHRQWLFQSSEGGNAAYRAGHLLERVVSTLGSVKGVSADLTTLVPERPVLGGPGSLGGDQVDNMSFLLELERGIRGAMQLSYTAWFGTGVRFEAYGTEGMLALARPTFGVGVETKRADPGYLEAADLFGARLDRRSLFADGRAPESLLHRISRIPVDDSEDVSVSELPAGGSAYGVWRAFRAFGNAIARGEPFIPDFETGLALHCVLETAERSSRARAWTAVTDVTNESTSETT